MPLLPYSMVVNVTVAVVVAVVVAEHSGLCRQVRFWDEVGIWACRAVGGEEGEVSMSS